MLSHASWPEELLGFNDDRILEHLFNLSNAEFLPRSFNPAAIPELWLQFAFRRFGALAVKH